MKRMISKRMNVETVVLIMKRTKEKERYTHFFTDKQREFDEVYEGIF